MVYRRGMSRVRRFVVAGMLFSCFAGCFLGFRLREFGYAGGYELVVPVEEFLDVGGIYAVLIEIGKNLGKESAYFVIGAETFYVDRLTASPGLYGLKNLA